MARPPLTSLSPLDGRYAGKVDDLRSIFSEQGLIRYRTLVEIRWVQFLAERPEIAGVGPFPSVIADYLNGLIDDFGADDAERVKAIEATTNHDVKAIEYFIADRFGEDAELNAIRPYLHFACTSEDINNIAYALMLRDGRDSVVAPLLARLGAKLRETARASAGLAMLSHTHGQAASPTTLGKELANIAWRLERQIGQLLDVRPLAKINGAVGNFNAHVTAYPDADWIELGREFIQSLGLTWNPFTTQIEPHDWIAEYCQALTRVNNVMLDASRDIWAYISLGYFRQRTVRDEVGSSTMPHKVNPIDFENAEGNLGLANALLNHLASKLPVSRWQRDLSDSTVQRNLGVAIGHGVIAYRSFTAGLDRLDPDARRIAADLEDRWELLAEPVQTVMRRHGIVDAYEQLKTLTRGEPIDRDKLHAFIRGLDIPEPDRDALLALRPGSYTGLAERLVESFDELRKDIDD